MGAFSPPFISSHICPYSINILLPGHTVEQPNRIRKPFKIFHTDAISPLFIQGNSMHAPFLATPCFIFTAFPHCLNNHLNMILWPIKVRLTKRRSCSYLSNWCCQMDLTLFFSVHKQGEMFENLCFWALNYNFNFLVTLSTRCTVFCRCFAVCPLHSASKTCSYFFVSLPE